MRARFCFVIVNILLSALILWTLLPERIFTLQAQGPAIRLRERQLAIMEENFRLYDYNMALLEGFGTEAAEAGYIIQPSGYIGAILTDVRMMLHLRGLDEIEFFSSVAAFHNVNGRGVEETRATVVAQGTYADILAFLTDMAHHYRYLRLERIVISEISEEFTQTRLWLTFSIYEKE